MLMVLEMTSGALGLLLALGLAFGAWRRPPPFILSGLAITAGLLCWLLGISLLALGPALTGIALLGCGIGTLAANWVAVSGRRRGKSVFALGLGALALFAGAASWWSQSESAFTAATLSVEASRSRDLMAARIDDASLRFLFWSGSARASDWSDLLTREALTDLKPDFVVVASKTGALSLLSRPEALAQKRRHSKEVPWWILPEGEALFAYAPRAQLLLILCDPEIKGSLAALRRTLSEQRQDHRFAVVVQVAAPRRNPQEWRELVQAAKVDLYVLPSAGPGEMRKSERTTALYLGGENSGSLFGVQADLFQLAITRVPRPPVAAGTLRIAHAQGRAWLAGSTGTRSRDGAALALALLGALLVLFSSSNRAKSESARSASAVSSVDSSDLARESSASPRS
ncbi:MAG: hypothetical protein V3W41_20650 [Planctomycetota bacterium]